MDILFCKGPSAQIQLKSLSHLHQVKHMIVGCQIRLQTIRMQLKFGFLLITVHFPTPVRLLRFFFATVLNHLFTEFLLFCYCGRSYTEVCMGIFICPH